METIMLYGVSPERVREILTEARNKMNDEGAHWIKGRLSRKKKVGMCYCALGAINAATKDNEERLAAKDALIRFGLGRTPHISSSAFARKGVMKRVLEPIIYTFNDSVTTSWNDVDAAFRKAVRGIK
jgi:hypothetical protein